jgi:hypothetical protein
MIVQITNYLTNTLTTNTYLTVIFNLVVVGFLFFLMHGRQTLTFYDLYVHMCSLPTGHLNLEKKNGENMKALNLLIKLQIKCFVRPCRSSSG